MCNTVAPSMMLTVRIAVTATSDGRCRENSEPLQAISHFVSSFFPAHEVSAPGELCDALASVRQRAATS